MPSDNPRQSVIQTGYKHTEVGVIPEDWEITQLRSIAVVSIEGRGHAQ